MVASTRPVVALQASHSTLLHRMIRVTRHILLLSADSTHYSRVALMIKAWRAAHDGFDSRRATGGFFCGEGLCSARSACHRSPYTRGRSGCSERLWARM